MKGTVALVALVSLVAMADCGGGGSGAGNASCRGILKRYESCGVFSGGDNSCHAQPERQYDACFSDCVDQASCQQIEAYVCNGTTTTCMNVCANQSFLCDNGHHVDALAQCDGFDDCGDNSDEQGCQLGIFRCEVQGQEIPAGEVCDGNVDCVQSGADEVDCGQFLCFGTGNAAEADAGQSLLPYSTSPAGN